LFVANALSLQYLAVATVLAGGVWGLDVAEASEQRGLHLGGVPLMLSVFASVVACYRFGVPGLAAATVGSGLGVLVWAVLVPRFRPIESVAASVSLALVAAFGSGSLVLLRLRSEEEALSFLVVAAASVAASWLADRSEIAGIDPIVVGIVVALGAGAVAGAVWSEDLWPTAVAAGGAAVALVAGRSLGSLVRSGGFFLTRSTPGSLHYLDGPLMAAGPFWLLIRLLA
jgi:hypothetical protein